MAKQRERRERLREGEQHPRRGRRIRYFDLLEKFAGYGSTNRTLPRIYRRVSDRLFESELSGRIPVCDDDNDMSDPNS